MNTTANAAHGRMMWMDVLRGIAIALVVLAHSAYILPRFEFGAPPGWLISFNELFAPFRMPTLMALSGMLVPASLRKPPAVYFSGKLRNVAWPYLVWLVLWCAFFPTYGSLFNVDTWLTSYLWFLLYITVFYLLAPITRFVPTWLFVLAPWVVASLELGMFQRRFFFLMGFFFLGKLVAERGNLVERVLRSQVTWFALPIAIAYGVAFSLLDPKAYVGWTAPFSIAGILAAALLARVVDARRAMAPVRYVGRHSLIFYVTHFPVITAISAAGAALRTPELITIVVGFVAAMLVGWGATWMSQNTFARALFAFPARTGTIAIPRE